MPSWNADTRRAADMRFGWQFFWLVKFWRLWLTLAALAAALIVAVMVRAWLADHALTGAGSFPWAAVGILAVLVAVALAGGFLVWRARRRADEDALMLAAAEDDSWSDSSDSPDYSSDDPDYDEPVQYPRGA